MKNNHFILLIILAITIASCSKDDKHTAPNIFLKTNTDYTSDSAIIAIGDKIVFGIVAKGIDAPITNLNIKIEGENGIQTMLDTGIYEESFEWDKVFYQGIDDTLNWIISVMDHNRQQISINRLIIKDPNSTFGGIRHYPSIIIGYQDNEEVGHYFDPTNGKIYFSDSARLNQNTIDMLCYFNFSQDNGVNLPSPTFSSPAENTALSGYLYTVYYPEITTWTNLNYTKWDISADNGITQEKFSNTHHDSLLIVSYNDVWGKKKYKWAKQNTFIPIQTSSGKKGIVKVINADTTATGTIEFELKIQH